jgi:drug/metabolite transporter (DMT)-like permease
MTSACAGLSAASPAGQRMPGSSLQSLWMLLASFGFACMGVCVKFAALRFSAAEIVFYRSVISLCLMFGLVRAQNVAIRTPYWRLQFFRGGSGFASLLLYFYAISMLPLATAVTLNYTSPLFLVVFLAGFGGVRLPRLAVAVLLAGFLGVALLLRPTLAAEQWVAGLIGLASGILAGLAYFNVRALGQLGEPEVRTVFYFSLLSSAGAALWMAFFDFHRVDFNGGLLLLGVGAFATIAQLAMTRSYKQGNAMLSASLAYSAVIFASVFGAFFWNETLGPDAWLAIALIVGSGLLATRVSRQRPVNPAEQD